MVSRYDRVRVGPLRLQRAGASCYVPGVGWVSQFREGPVTTFSLGGVDFVIGTPQGRCSKVGSPSTTRDVSVETEEKGER